MKSQSSFATLTDFHCPICGASQAGNASTSRNSAFACSRCWNVLEVATSRSLTVLSASIVVSLSLSIAMGLQGPSFALSLIGTAAAFNWLGQSIRSLVVSPRLRVRPNAQVKGVPMNVLAAPRSDRSPRPTRRHESLQCPLVVTHG